MSHLNLTDRLSCKRLQCWPRAVIRHNSFLWYGIQDWTSTKSLWHCKEARSNRRDFIKFSLMSLDECACSDGGCNPHRKSIPIGWFQWKLSRKLEAKRTLTMLRLRCVFVNNPNMDAIQLLNTTVFSNWVTHWMDLSGIKILFKTGWIKYLTKKCKASAASALMGWV